MNLTVKQARLFKLPNCQIGGIFILIKKKSHPPGKGDQSTLRNLLLPGQLTVGELSPLGLSKEPFSPPIPSMIMMDMKMKNHHNKSLASLNLGQPCTCLKKKYFNHENIQTHAVYLILLNTFFIFQVSSM